jgi:plastocyanin
MKKSALMLVIMTCAGFTALPAADITGKVTLKGTPPPPQNIDFSDYAQCGDLHPDVTATRWYVTSKDNGLKDVFVYISKGCEGKTFPVPDKPVELDQDKCAYQPYVMGIMVGQKLNIKDLDPVTHNVHCVPSNEGNEEFNLMQVDKGQVDAKVFNKPDVMVRFECNVHQWMFAYVGVVDNPYFAVTDADGNYKIPNLPPGDYTLTAYHVKAHGTSPGVKQEIKVTGDAAVTANFTVEVPK